MEVRGNAIAYTGGTTGRPLPKATDHTRRATHRPWCTNCKRKHDATDLTDGLCARCVRAAEFRAKAAADRAAHQTTQPPTKGKRRARADVYPQLPPEALEQRFTAPDRTLDEELYILEQTDPAVAAEAAAYDAMVERVTRPEDHIQTPELPEAGNQGKPTTRRSAPRATSSSSITGRAPVAGTATHRGKNPPATQETRRAVAGGPTPEQELDAQITHVTRVLRATANLASPAARMLRLNALSAIEALHLFTQMSPETPAPPNSTPLARAGRPDDGQEARPGEDANPAAGRASTTPTTPQNRRVMGDWTTEKKRRAPQVTRRTIDIAEARRLYLDELQTCPQIAKALGSTPAGVRKALRAAGVPLRDDRAGHSGGHNKPIVHSPELVAQVRGLYVDEELTIDQVAARLDLTHKIVAGIMRRHDIPRRPGAHVSGLRPGADHAVGLKQQITDLGITARDIKTWALEQGLVTPHHDDSTHHR